MARLGRGFPSYRYKRLTTHIPQTYAANLSITQGQSPVINKSISRARLITQGQLLNSSGTPYTNLILSDSPVSYWRLNETSGTNAVDQQGAHTGGYSLGFTLGAAGALGGSGDADLAVNLGTTGYVATSYNPFVSGGQQTFEGWANAASNPQFEALFGGNLATNSTPPVLYFDTASQLSFYPLNGVSTPWVAAWPGLSQWVYWALTYNDATGVAELFINAVSQGQVTIVERYGTTGNLVLGGAYSSAHTFPGLLDDVAIYSKILSPSQIAAHYAAGTTIPAVPTSLKQVNSIRTITQGTGGQTLLIGDATTTYTVADNNSSGSATYLSFTALTTGTLDTLRFRTSGVVNTATSVIMGVYSDVSGPAIVLGSATLSGTPPVNSWISVSGLNVAITQGVVYWLAIAAIGGTVAWNDAAASGGTSEKWTSFAGGLNNNPTITGTVAQGPVGFQGLNTTTGVTLVRQINATRKPTPVSSILTESKIIGKVSTVTQGTSPSVIKQNTITKSISQAQSITTPKSIVRVRAFVQTSSLNHTISVGKPYLLTQAQIVTISKGHVNVITKAITQGQSLFFVRQSGLIRSATQAQSTSIIKLEGVTRQVTQGQSISLIRQDGKILKPVQAQLVIIGHLNAKTISIVKASTPTIARLTSHSIPLITQAQTVFFSKQKLRLVTLLAVQNQLTFVSRMENLIKAISQGQALSESRSISIHKTMSQASSLNLIRNTQKLEILVQSQNTVFNRTHSNFRALAITQGNAASIKRQVSLIRSIVQNSTVITGHLHNKTLVISEPSLLSLSRQYSRLFTTSLGQSLYFSKTQNRIVHITQGQLVLPFSPFLTKTFFLPQAQNLVLLIIPYLPSSTEELFIMIAPSQTIPFYTLENLVIPFYVSPVIEDQIVPVQVWEDTKLGVSIPSSLVGEGYLP